MQFGSNYWNRTISLDITILIFFNINTSIVCLKEKRIFIFVINLSLSIRDNNC